MIEKIPKHTLLLIIFACGFMPFGEPLQAQYSEEFKKAVATFNYDQREDNFYLYSLPFASGLSACQRRNRPFEWRRSRKCKCVVRKVEVGLQEAIQSDNYSDFGKALIYQELFRVSDYLRRPNLALLDTSVQLYQRRIKALNVYDIQYGYEGYRTIYLRGAIWKMWDYVERRHQQKFYEIRQNHYLAYLNPGSFCDFGNDWIEPNYYIHLAMFMYEKEYYGIASEFIHYQGLNVGNTYYGNSNVNVTEQRKQFFYARSMSKLYSREELAVMKSATLEDIIIARYQYTVLGYSYLGNHLINVDFRKPLKELEQMSDEELKAVAKEILMDSIIFEEL